jgi:hypothetical protein
VFVEWSTVTVAIEDYLGFNEAFTSWMLEYQHVATPPAFLEGSHAIKVRVHKWEIARSFVAGFGQG